MKQLRNSLPLYPALTRFFRRTIPLRKKSLWIKEFRAYVIGNETVPSNNGCGLEFPSCPEGHSTFCFQHRRIWISIYRIFFLSEHSDWPLFATEPWLPLGQKAAAPCNQIAIYSTKSVVQVLGWWTGTRLLLVPWWFLLTKWSLTEDSMFRLTSMEQQ